MSTDQPTAQPVPEAPHTCLDGALICAACRANFEASPAGIVTKAIDTLAAENPDNELADLLQHLADEMSDEHAEEKHLPGLAAGYRFQVSEWYGQGPERDRWTYALAVARQILGLPNPNKDAAPEAGEQA